MSEHSDIATVQLSSGILSRYFPSFQLSLTSFPFSLLGICQCKRNFACLFVRLFHSHSHPIQTHPITSFPSSHFIFTAIIFFSFFLIFPFLMFPTPPHPISFPFLLSLSYSFPPPLFLISIFVQLTLIKASSKSISSSSWSP